LDSFLEPAACWLLHSGIQEASGGVARYYRLDSGTNLPVSSEITGYAISTLAYLHSLTGNSAYLDAAFRAARYLTSEVWDGTTFPFEPGSDRAYFFDIGIIVRGLLAASRLPGGEEFREAAHQAALSLAFDFMGDEAPFHPIVSLPDKQPLAHEKQWSRSPGCYQLKSALAWHDISVSAGDEHAQKLYETVLAYSLATHDTFLFSEPVREKQMDRLHAYSYFLEALLAASDRPLVREALATGVARAAALYREIAPTFERSDVAAQILRVRLIAHHIDALPLDEAAASHEAARAASFQAAPDHPDPRLRGGFYFGSKRGEMLPFSNPVSTGFCLQALQLWQQHQSGRWNFNLQQLI
jgi:hypothetical protein